MEEYKTYQYEEEIYFCIKDKNGEKIRVKNQRFCDIFDPEEWEDFENDMQVQDAIRAELAEWSKRYIKSDWGLGKTEEIRIEEPSTKEQKRCSECANYSICKIIDKMEGFLHDINKGTIFSTSYVEKIKQEIEKILTNGCNLYE
jgi:hypothetical protein